MCAGDVCDFRTLGHIFFFNITSFIGKIDQHLERNHLDAEFGFVLLHDFLRIIRTVEWLATRIISRPRMISADNEVIGAVIAADDGMKQSFLWTCHAHCQWEQAKHGVFLIVVIINQRLVRADAGIVIDVTGLGHADHGMNDQRAFDFRRGALGEFLVDAVQGIASLESNDVVVSHLFEHFTHLSGRVT